MFVLSEAEGLKMESKAAPPGFGARSERQETFDSVQTYLSCQNTEKLEKTP